MKTKSLYDPAFFGGQKDLSYSSAKTVIPQVISLCGPRSVVDIGCGVGPWLRACVEAGIEDVVGVDGDYVRDELLLIPKEKFVRADIARSVDLKRQFDLVMSLEVAEHLPEPRASEFVETLTRHGKIVLFSAAVPIQGGTHHVNEQWPQYWASLFSERDYLCIDCLRALFWEEERIAWWYRQNILLFVERTALPRLPELYQASTQPPQMPLAVVHPGFMMKLKNEKLGVRDLLRKIPGTLRAAVSQRL